MAESVQFAEQALDLRVDPGIVAAGGGIRAAGDGAGEVAVHRDGERVRQHGAGEAARHMEAIQRHDAPALRVQPVETLTAAGLGHREQAVTVGPQHEVSRDLNGAPGHAAYCGVGWRVRKDTLAGRLLWRVNGAGPQAVRSGGDTMAKYTWEHIHLRSPDPAGT